MKGGDNGGKEKRKNNRGSDMEGKENKMEVTGNSTEEEKGIRVWVRQGRIRIDEQWWEWNEEEEVLRQERENVKGGKQGTQKEEKRGGM